jgi:hypothetical protein
MATDFVELKKGLDLDVVAEVLNSEHNCGLRKRGVNYIAVCLLPSHTGEKKQFGKFILYRDSMRFYCHQCKQGGDVIDLVSILREVSKPDAAAWLQGLQPQAAAAPAADKESESEEDEPERRSTTDITDEQLAKWYGELSTNDRAVYSVMARIRANELVEAMREAEDPRAVLRCLMLYVLSKVDQSR